MGAKTLLFSLLRIAVCQWAGDEAVGTACTEETLNGAYALAARYDLAHLLGIALNKLGLGHREIAQKATHQQMLATYRYLQLSHEQEAVSKVLEEGEIPFIPLKGAVLRDLYPEVWMRTSCDMDILIHAEDLERTANLLQTKLQYTPKGKTAHDLSLDSPGGVHLELHYTVLEQSELAMLPKVLETIWDAATPVEGKQYHMVLSDAMFYCYHIAHMAKHFEIGGVGIRPFLDIWVLQNRIAFDQKARTALLEEGGLLPFAKAAEKLSAIWFAGAETDQISCQMERFVLSGGLYAGVENRVAVTHARDHKGLSYVLFRLLLPYEAMKIQYPILEKQKWLLPFCHIARWCKRLFDGGLRRGAKELRASASMDAETVLTTQALLQHLGLQD